MQNLLAGSEYFLRGALLVQPSSVVLDDMLADLMAFRHDLHKEYASSLARALDLTPWVAWIETFEGTDALVIDRYDRYDRDVAIPGRRLPQHEPGRSGSCCQQCFVANPQRFYQLRITTVARPGLHTKS